MKSSLKVLVLVAILQFGCSQALAMPSSCGSTGLLNQPTAQTLDSGNICVGVSADHSRWGQTPATEQDATVVPFSITLGLGSFFEAYGSYPNLLFNDDEDLAGSGYTTHGYSTLGAKLRLLGKRSSLVKFAAEAQFKRAISMNPNKDGLTDTLYRGIVSLQTKRFGLHGWRGVLNKEENLTGGVGPFEDIAGYGGGIEIMAHDRLRIIAEAEYYKEDQIVPVKVGEWMAGFQYFVSPHLTLNLGYGGGFEGEDLNPALAPDKRILVGFSTCQGIGSYSQIKRTSLPDEEVAEVETSEPVKVLKIRTLTPLMVKSRPVAAAPTITPKLPAADIAIEQVSPAIPVVSLPQLLESAPVAMAVEVPVEEYTEILIAPGENIATTDAFKRQSGRRTDSPVGPPMMATVERLPVKPGKARVYRRFLLPEFSFEVDQHSLTREGSAALSMIAVELSQDTNWHAMRVDGHTDSTGSDRYNKALSYNRAVEYAMHLVAKNGIDPERVFVKGFGEMEPISANDTPEGRSKNRRVEIQILVPPE